MQNFINREPAILTAVVTAALDILIAFGVPLDDGVKSTVVPVAVALLTLFAGLIIRSQVSPVKK